MAGKPARSKEVGWHGLSRNERRIIRSYEEGKARERAACTRRIFSQRENANQIIEIEVAENYLAFKTPDLVVPKNHNGRGKITGFSRAARRRQIKDFASLKEYPHVWQDFTFADDVMQGKTLTERAEYSSECLKAFKREIETWGVSGRWKREWEERKSGRLKGELVPHFHMLLDWRGASEEAYRRRCVVMAEAWVRITGTQHPAALAVAISERSYRWIVSKRMAQVYVSKYMAKVQHIDEGETLGRFWGKIGELEEGPKVIHRLSFKEGVWLRRILAHMVRNKAYRRSIRAGSGFLLVSRGTVVELIAYINAYLLTERDREGMAEGLLEENQR